MFPIILGEQSEPDQLEDNVLLSVSYPQGFYLLSLVDNQLYESMETTDEPYITYQFIEPEKLKKLVLGCSRGYYKQTESYPAVSFAKEILEVVAWYEEKYLKSAETVPISEIINFNLPIMDISSKDEETLFLLCNMRLALDEYYNSFLDFTKDKKEKHEGSRLALLRSLETMVKLTLEKIHGMENDAQNN
jgi:hypothetical protein